jgi:hypothetical protein
LLFALLTAVASPALGEVVRLVSDEEFARERDYAATPAAQYEARSAPAPDAPSIEVRNPRLNDTLSAPFPIRIAFSAREGAEIVPASFRVYYGMLRLDITDRVLQNVKVAPAGFSVEEADIPAGSHRLLLQITDSKGRVGETTLSFRVAQ